MANILKLQDQLKGLPDNALVKYAQNPTGEVPQYLVLGELQRRKTMREEFAQTQAPQSTVADDLTAGIASVAPQQAPAEEAPPPEMTAPEEGMAEGGLAELPIPDDMYQEASMATGGIVAFDGGGEVPRFAGQGPSLVSSMPNYEPSLSALVQRKLALEKELSRLIASGAGQLESDRASLLGVVGAPARGLRNLIADSTAGLQNISGRVQNLISGKPEYKTNIDYGTETAPISKIDLLQEEIAALEGAITQTEKQGNLPIAGQPAVAPSTAKAAPSGMAIPKVGAAPTLPAAPVMDVASGLQLLETEPARQALLRAQDENTKEAILARLAAEKEQFGIKDVLTPQMEEIAKERESLKGKKGEAGWMAALEAGLGIAGGTSPFALTNLGQGAMQGVRSYKDSIKEINQNERELRREANSIVRAQQDVARADMRDQRGEVQRGEDRILQAQERFDRRADANALTQNQALQWTLGKQFDRDLADFSARSADYRLDKTLAADAAKHAQLMKMYEDKITAAGRRDAILLQRNRVTALANMNKDPEYISFVDQLNEKYKKKGGATNQDYQIEKQVYINAYLSDALGLSSLTNVTSADDL